MNNCPRCDHPSDTTGLCAHCTEEMTYGCHERHDDPHGRLIDPAAA